MLSFTPVSSRDPSENSAEVDNSPYLVARNIYLKGEHHACLDVNEQRTNYHPQRNTRTLAVFKQVIALNFLLGSMDKSPCVQQPQTSPLLKM